MEQKTSLTPEQFEQGLQELPTYSKILMEQARFRNDCRKKSLDVAGCIGKISEKDVDVLLADAQKIYDWLVEPDNTTNKK